jgi:hypothetical protein
MEQPLVKIIQDDIMQSQVEITDTQERTFIAANTIPITLHEMKQRHIIPVFVKDNEPVISHAEFIEITSRAVNDYYIGEQILQPVIRLSHPIKGRIPEAKDKPANQLQDWEKTVYYERMMFLIEIPSITDMVGDNKLSLVVGGVKAYHQDNLYSRSICDQHFKLFIGFQNKVCTNMCVWSDGYIDDVKVRSIEELYGVIANMLVRYNHGFHLFNLKQLCNYSITEQQFAQMVGRCRMYHHLPMDIKKGIKPLLFNDTQLGAVCRDYYRDASFCKQEDGNINLWSLFNLFTGVNKSSYIDLFLDRSVNAYNFVEQLRFELDNKSICWYIH